MNFTNAPAAPQLSGPLFDQLDDIRRQYAPFQHIGASGRIEYVACEADKAKIQQVRPGDELTNYDCRFQAQFYNPRKPNGQQMSRVRNDDDNNPDPEFLEPVTIYGIEALLRRFEDITRRTAKLRDDIVRKQSAIVELRTLDHDQRLQFEQKQQRQAQLYNRMLRLLSIIEKYRFQDRPLELEEYAFREKAEKMLLQLQQRHVELTQLINFQSQHDLIKDEYADNLSDDDLRVIYDAMAKQSEGLEHVSEILRRDIRHVEIIQEKLDQVGYR